VAIALIVATTIYLRGFRADSVGLYSFVLAEISPISERAPPVLVLTYQFLCILLLFTMLSSPDAGNDIRIYRKAALQTAGLATIPVALYAFLVRAQAFDLSGGQLSALAALALIASLCVVLVAMRPRGSLINAAEH
jgi:hypothetical protein